MTDSDANVVRLITLNLFLNLSYLLHIIHKINGTLYNNCNLSVPGIVSFAVLARTVHHDTELLVVDLSIPGYLSIMPLLYLDIYSDPSMSASSTRLKHSSSVIFSPRFIITFFSSDLEM